MIPREGLEPPIYRLQDGCLTIRLTGIQPVANSQVCDVSGGMNKLVSLRV